MNMAEQNTLKKIIDKIFEVGILLKSFYRFILKIFIGKFSLLRIFRKIFIHYFILTLILKINNNKKPNPKIGMPSG